MGTAFVSWVGAQHADAVSNAITWAGNKVLFYCQRRASVAQLEANSWAVSAATTLACYKLTGYGGEPHNAATKEEMEDIVGELSEIRDMKSDIPGLVYGPNETENKGAGPVLSIMAVDVTRTPAVRRVVPGSTGHPAGYPDAKDLPSSFPRRPN